MEIFLFALSRIPDPYAILLGSTIGIVSLHWWQALLAGLAGGVAIALAFGFFGGMSPDAPAYFVVDAMAVAVWASLAFALREMFRRRKAA